ncbi:hypothetical protein TrVE_jg10407 [Triparma verrucosa]|uniref:Uncharacterized protein n=1 Tax=Triparma verrucosa TaxID=1606542 RepID=A0A9W7KS02_9STRA|nr:hypothetical protein TrVE_jg10407 [Triparma verrucosa]
MKFANAKTEEDKALWWKKLAKRREDNIVLLRKRELLREKKKGEENDGADTLYRNELKVMSGMLKYEMDKFKAKHPLPQKKLDLIWHKMVEAMRQLHILASQRMDCTDATVREVSSQLVEFTKETVERMRVMEDNIAALQEGQENLSERLETSEQQRIRDAVATNAAIVAFGKKINDHNYSSAQERSHIRAETERKLYNLKETIKAIETATDKQPGNATIGLEAVQAQQQQQQNVEDLIVAAVPDSDDDERVADDLEPDTQSSPTPGYIEQNSMAGLSSAGGSTVDNSDDEEEEDDNMFNFDSSFVSSTSTSDASQAGTVEGDKKMPATGGPRKVLSDMNR